MSSQSPVSLPQDSEVLKGRDMRQRDGSFCGRARVQWLPRRKGAGVRGSEVGRSNSEDLLLIPQEGAIAPALPAGTG